MLETKPIPEGSETLSAVVHLYNEQHGNQDITIDGATNNDELEKAKEIVKRKSQETPDGFPSGAPNPVLRVAQMQAAQVELNLSDLGHIKLGIQENAGNG